MSSAGDVQRPDYADFRYQEAVGNLKQLLSYGGSCSGRGSDVASVRSRARSTSRALDSSALRPEMGRYRSEVSSYRRHVSGSRLHTSSYTADTASYRADSTSYRPELANIRPQSAMEVGSGRRLGPLTMGTGSVRDVSPVSVRSFRLTADEHLRLDDDVIGPDAVDTDGGYTKLGDNGNTDPSQQQVLLLRQEALSRQLELENAELREAAGELRSYVQQLVAENGSLAEQLRSRLAESVPAGALETAEARLREAKEELERLRRHVATQQQHMEAEHAEQLKTAHTERDNLTSDIGRLEADLEERTRQAEKAEQKAAASAQQAEQAHSARLEADSTAARLRSELGERGRRADRVQMEHERRLVAAGEQAELAVRHTFDRLQQQLDRQRTTIAELEEDRERQQRRERELTSELEQERQAATQAKLDADSAAQRHHRELQSLQKRLQPAVPLSTGQDRLHREVLTLRQQLSAAENQLTSANRERGRLQQQLWRLDRRPDGEALSGVLGDDGMTALPRHLDRLLGRTAVRGAVSPQRHQQPTSYRQVKDSDLTRSVSPPMPNEDTSGSGSVSQPASRGSPSVGRKLSQPITSRPQSRGSPTGGRKYSQGSSQSRDSPSLLRRALPEAGSTETVTEIIEIISPRGEYLQRTETEHEVSTAPEQRPEAQVTEHPEDRSENQKRKNPEREAQNNPEERELPQPQQQPPDKNEKQQKNQEQQQEQQKEQQQREPKDQPQRREEKQQPQQQSAQHEQRPSAQDQKKQPQPPRQQSQPKESLQEPRDDEPKQDLKL